MIVNLVYGRHFDAVYVDGVPLDPGASQRVFNHSPDGFAWGYGGSGPHQLGLALLLYAGVSEEQAVRLCPLFVDEFLAELPKADASIVVDPVQWARIQDSGEETGVQDPDLAIYLAMNAVRELRRDYEFARRAKSIELFGHSGASVGTLVPYPTLEDEMRAALLAVGVDPSQRLYLTKTGRSLTDADIEALADEAERGYDVKAFVGVQGDAIVVMQPRGGGVGRPSA